MLILVAFCLSVILIPLSLPHTAGVSLGAVITIVFLWLLGLALWEKRKLSKVSRRGKVGRK